MKKLLILSCIILVFTACKKKEFCNCSSFFEGRLVDTYEVEITKDKNKSCNRFETDVPLELSPDSAGVVCKYRIEE